MKRVDPRTVTVAVTGILLGGVVGMLWGRGVLWRTPELPQTWKAVRENADGYRFTQPLLAVGDDARLRQHPQLEDAVRAYAHEQERAGKATKVSVYMKDFQTSTWAGIDEDEKYVLASMYKVILMVALLKQAQRDPTVLNTSIIFDIEEPITYGNESNTSPDPIQKGKRYTIGDLIARMIIYSDNNAKDLLYAFVDRSVLVRTYRDLGLELSENDSADVTMSAQDFSLFFRVFYNASYVDRALSEEALGVLSQVVFRDGLVAGVPKDVPVAHKFGYRIIPESGIHELHDCGIIYFPERPYLLCVMTRGSAYEDLRDTIAGVSRVVYEKHAAESAR